MTNPTGPDPLAEAHGTSGPVPHKTPHRLTLAATLPYVAPALLVAVAVNQIILASTAHLTPWTGGGFGMFSSVDNIRARVVRPILRVDRREIPIKLESTDALATDLFRAGLLPTRARLTTLADSLARRTWLLDGSTQVATPAGVASPPPGTRIIRSPTVRIEVHRIHFLPQTLELERVLIADATVGQ